MLAAYAFLGLIVFAIVDGLNALRSSTEKAARSWAVTMVLLPTFAGGIATLILVGAATIVGTDVSSSLARLVLVPEAALLLFLARAWRRSLAGDKDQRLRLSAVLLRSSAHPHRGFAIGLMRFLRFPSPGLFPSTWEDLRFLRLKTSTLSALRSKKRYSPTARSP